MPTEKSAGAIIFRREPFAAAQGKKTLFFYLLLHYPSTPRAKKEYWGFTKGHIEKNETIEQAAVREIQEETGITNVNFKPGFREEEKYFFMKNGRRIFKTVTFLLGETETEKITLSSEHIGFLWLPYEDAFNKLTFENGKEILKKAESFLLRQK